MKILFFLILFLLPNLLYGQQPSSPENWILENIVCSGNERTDCEFIKKEIYLSPGDKINEEEIQNAKFRLGVLGLFKKIDFQLKKGTKPGFVSLDVQVNEESAIYTESKLGITNWYQIVSPLVGTKVGDRNLFGTGKSLELEVDYRYITRGFSALYSRLQYTDPHLFSTQRNFLIAGATYYSLMDSFPEVTYDIALGRRIFDFSYISIGARYRYFPGSPFSEYIYNSDSTALLNYGWNSEDDAFFPTQGSKFIFSTQFTLLSSQYPFQGAPAPFFFNFSYNKTWRLTDVSYLTLVVGGDPQPQYNPITNDEMALSIKYSHDIFYAGSGDIQHGRWYIAPGIIGYSRGGSGIAAYPFYPGGYGARAGLRFDSKSLGIIDLYFMATRLGDWH